MLASVKNYAVAFIAAVLIFGIVALFLYPWMNKNLFNGFAYETEQEEQTGENNGQQGTVDTSGSTEEQKPVEVEGESFTTLIVISDYQPKVFDDYRADVPQDASLEILAENSRHYRADVTVLMRVDKESGHFIFTAVPYNTRVSVKGLTMMLGSVYEKYGFEVYSDIVSSITGLKIDHRIEMQMDLFKDIVNMTDGIEFNVPQNMNEVYEEERIVGKGQSRDPIVVGTTEEGEEIIELPGTPYTINLNQGLQTLNANKALQLLRFNGYAENSPKRATVAAEFMKAFADEVFNSENIDTVRGALSKIILSELGNTNLTLSEFDSVEKMLVAYGEFTSKVISFPCTYVASADADSYFTYSQRQAYAAYEPYKD